MNKACYLYLPIGFALLFIASMAGAQGRRVTPAPATVGRRMALVIGNQDYQQIPLRNPIADAKAMRAALQETGFSAQIFLNLQQRAFEEAIDRFVSTVNPGDVALFYFSGHGIGLETGNYLLPTDFAARQESDVRYRAYPAARVLDKLKDRGAALVVLILDACRNNPWHFGRDYGGGLQAMSAGRGALIAFAADEGEQAIDNVAGQNGLFTTYLLQEMRKPATPLDEVLKQVTRSVYRASDGKQLPVVYGALLEDFVFVPGVSRSSNAGSVKPGSSSGCELLPTAKSIKGDEPVQITIVNSTLHPVQTFWIDYNGKYVKYADLSPGGQTAQPTYLTHPWLITDNAGNCLSVYLPKKEATVVTVVTPQ